jgi:hypothetical protein
VDHEQYLDEEVARWISVATVRAYVALALCPSGEERKRNQYGMRRRIVNAYGAFGRIWYDLGRAGVPVGGRI